LDSPESSDLERWLLDNAAREQPTSSMLGQLRANLGMSAASAIGKPSALAGIKTTLLAISLGTLMGVHAADRGAAPSPESHQTRPALIHTGELQTVNIAPSSASLPLPNSADSIDEGPPVRTKETLASAKSVRAGRGRDRESLSVANRSPTGPDLREEIRLLDLARNAVRGQRPEEALASLNVYSQRFPAGAFRQEASVLRMQALAKRGDVSQASSMAKQFVESHPNSPYVHRASTIAKGSVAPEAR